MSGFTAARPASSDPVTEWGDTWVRYDNWSKGNRAPSLQIDLPYSRPTQFSGDQMESGDIAGDYAFVMSGFDATIRIYDRRTGAFVGIISPGPEVGRSSGWVDIYWGLQAFKRSDGEYILIAEEDLRAKFLLYRWRPDGSLTSAGVPGSAPYRDHPATIPGVVYAANFDEGGEGIAYHDTSKENPWQNLSAYRRRRRKVRQRLRHRIH